MFSLSKRKNFISRLRKRLLGFPHTTRAERVKYRQALLTQSKPGDLLQIVHVNGVAYIYSIELNAVLGEIEKPLCKKLVKIFGKGFCLDAKLLSVTGGPPYSYYGIRLEIYDTKTFLSAIENFDFLKEQ